MAIALPSSEELLHQRSLYRSQRSGRLPSSRSGETPMPGPAATDATLPEQGKERRWERELRFVKRAAGVAGTAATLAGQGGIGSALQNVGRAAGDVEAAQDGSAGFGRRVGSNQLGRQTSKALQTRGMGGGSAAAAAGAVAALAAGQNLNEIALNAGRWYARKIAFGALLDPEPVGWTAAVLWLNVDFIQSTFFSSNEMASFSLLEKMGLLLADLFVTAILLLVGAIIYVIFNPCTLVKFADLGYLNFVRPFLEKVCPSVLEAGKAV